MGDRSIVQLLSSFFFIILGFTIASCYAFQATVKYNCRVLFVLGISYSTRATVLELDAFGFD